MTSFIAGLSPVFTMKVQSSLYCLQNLEFPPPLLRSEGMYYLFLSLFFLLMGDLPLDVFVIDIVYPRSTDISFNPYLRLIYSLSLFKNPLLWVPGSQVLEKRVDKDNNNDNNIVWVFLLIPFGWECFFNPSYITSDRFSWYHTYPDQMNACLACWLAAFVSFT